MAARLLGVCVDATASELRVAHRRAVKASHPDLFPSTERMQRTQEFHALTAAYRLLSGAVQPVARPVAQAIEARWPSADEIRYRTVLHTPTRGVRLDLAA